MPDQISPQSMAAIRSLFFGRRSKTNGELIQALTDLSLEIDGQNHNATLALLAEAENRIQTMRTIVIVFRECLER